MTREFNVIIERDSEGYFVASVPNIAGSRRDPSQISRRTDKAD